MRVYLYMYKVQSTYGENNNNKNHRNFFLLFTWCALKNLHK